MKFVELAHTQSRRALHFGARYDHRGCGGEQSSLLADIPGIAVAGTRRRRRLKFAAHDQTQPKQVNAG